MCKDIEELTLDDIPEATFDDPKANFQILDNIHVRGYWKSMNTNLDEDALLEPDWYQHNGTPIDSQGDDMEYIETRLYEE